jgi:23S rRNA (cytidine1920-2'-O)/16S rRNA (cytidine1409-2'-O)-methyltransferase
VSLVTLDLSFISVLKVMPAVAGLMRPGAQLVVLIKPQFEAGKAQVGAGGVVKDPQVSACAGVVVAGQHCVCAVGVVVVVTHSHAPRAAAAAAPTLRAHNRVWWRVQVHAEVIQRVTAGVEAYGLACRGVTESPLKGDKSGNTEFLAHFAHDPATGPLRVGLPPQSQSSEEEGQQHSGGGGGGGGGNSL